MTSTPWRACRIVGVAESDGWRADGRTAVELQAEAARRALADAGLDRHGVDGVCATRSGATAADYPAQEVAEYLGIRPSWIDSLAAGGSTVLLHLMNAAAAIASGMAGTVLITYGSTQRADRSRRLRGAPVAPWQPDAIYESKSGPLSPAGVAALSARRHMHDYGTTAQQLAEVAVQSRVWAAPNPLATRRSPVTVEEVLASAMLSSPLHVLDCCLVTDGAGALVLTSAERAADLPAMAITVAGAAALSTHRIASQAPFLDMTPASTTSRTALQQAGLRPEDVDVAGLYDAFTILPILLLESIGFCGRGEGGAFIADGHTAPGGRLPMNTQGGGLAYCHPGQFGIFLLVEAVRQLRSTAVQQVRDPQVALCHAVGGIEATHATVVLSRS